MCFRCKISAVLLLFLFKGVLLLENGLARTPPMGWMSWGYYQCADSCEDPNKCLDENLIMKVADTFYTEGYQEAGYEYIMIDDCWSEKERDMFGNLVPHQKRFPRGMKFLADYIHAKGLKFGMYLNIAETTCMHYPGSKGYFSVDAKQLAEWDVDYVKVDGCFVKEPYLDVAYIELGEALNKTGRPMVYGCSWPYYKKYIHRHDLDYSKVIPVCNLWRNFHDIFINWPNVDWILQFYEQNAVMLQPYHGPGHWCDPDMLVIGGGGMSDGQSRIQMAVWSMLSAPLILGVNMQRITPYERSLLQNPYLIAIDQDPMGIMAIPHKLFDHVTLWVKPHLPKKGDAYCSYSFAIVNTQQTDTFVSFDLENFGLNNTDEYTVLDVFNNEMVRNVSLNDSMDVEVSAMDVVVYTLYPL